MYAYMTDVAEIHSSTVRTAMYIKIHSLLDRDGQRLFKCVIEGAVNCLHYTKSFMAEGKYVAMVERSWQGKTTVLGDKYAQDPLCRPQIPFGLSLELKECLPFSGL
jgi:hypothetical protein